ncbi:hypothetical protein FACS1894110_23140 [Spirochaetia bacterium]|nr:hypothetical protein FACS1894110_23140 [Spirochaetia bacterium]
MKMSMTLFFLVFLLISCKKADNTHKGPFGNENSDFIENKINNSDNTNKIIEVELMFVNSPEGLRVRAEPNINSEKIYLLNNGQEVSILDKDINNVQIDGINGSWYLIQTEEITGWVFSGYLSNSIVGNTNTMPKFNITNTGIHRWVANELRGKEYIAIYKCKEIKTSEKSFGYEEIIKRLADSYLLIFERTGNNRYIYDWQGMIDYLPRSGDGTHGSDLIVNAAWESSNWKTYEDNVVLEDIFQVQFDSWRTDNNDMIIYDYEINVIYERIKN